MKSIHLQCPHCSALMELDAGFAGGVCRCFECGTLMTVPADPNQESPEMLVRQARPERPDAPASAARSESPGARGDVASPSESLPGSTPRPSASMPSSAGSGLAGQDEDDPLAALAAEAEALSSSGLRTRTDKRTAPPPPEPPEAAKAAKAAKAVESAKRPESSEPSDRPASTQPPVDVDTAPAGDAVVEKPGGRATGEVFVTPSGRKIRVTDVRRVPTARRRRKLIIQGTTAVVMFAGVAVLIGVMAWLVIMMLNAGKVDPDDPARFWQFNARANPFRSDAAEILQVPIPRRAVVSMQIGGPLLSNEAWDMVVEHLDQVLNRLPADQELSLRFWEAGPIRPFPEPGDPRRWTEADRQAWTMFKEQLTTYGRRGEPVEALRDALSGRPGHIILLIGQRLDDQQRTDVRALLDQHADVGVDLLVLDVDERDFGKVIQDRGGRFVAMPESQIIAWAEAAGLIEPAP
ncbi:MAG: hypothetical protein JJU36_02400 [Phycisphaeraceae bacterium]|nr:hypothetical protein [Phycisphaeraceae bacterium]